MKEAAYKGLVRPVLEYGSSVWDPHTHGLQEELEKVQNRAARFVTGNYGLCIKPVTEPDQTEPTEITELTRPNLRELTNVPDRTYGKCRYIDTGI